MTQTISKSETMTFEEFLDWYPEDKRFELIDGVIVEMQPTGKHEEIVEFLQRKLIRETDRLNLSYRFPRQVLIKPLVRATGYLPDVIVLNPNYLESEPLWKKAATLTLGKSIPLVIEVVSTNWENDYARKLEDYEKMGILEYWIVDYLGLGGRRFIGIDKLPTISVYTLMDNQYQLQQFRDTQIIQSITFPELQLTPEQIFNIT
jgi:Uma2 family endonuclease